MDERLEDDPTLGSVRDARGESAETLFVAPGADAPRPQGRLVLYVVASGGFTLSRRADARGALPLSRGDVVVLPPGSHARLRCDGDAPGELLRAVYSVDGAARASARVVHGASASGRLRTLVGLVRGELRDGDPALAARLLDPLLAYAARASKDAPPELVDALVAGAVARLRELPGHPWTVDELARRAGLSRSAFTRRFTRALGTSPLRWLARWRMRLAARRLAETDDSLAEIAAEVGYESEFSFSRAFRRHHGVPPGAFRRTHHRLRRRDEPTLRAA